MVRKCVNDHMKTNLKHVQNNEEIFSNNKANYIVCSMIKIKQIIINTFACFTCIADLVRFALTVASILGMIIAQIDEENSIKKQQRK